MEYEDDGQFSGIFLSEKIENVIRAKVQVDVPAENYTELEKKLETDLYKLANEEGMEAVEKFNFGVGDEEEEDIEEAAESPEEEEGEDEE